MIWTALALALETPKPQVPVGCVATVGELPTPDDERLRGKAVVVVSKAARKVMVFREGVLVQDTGPACWTVALGAGYPAGHKQVMGDMKTPEGWYALSDRPWSQFYGALTVHYPATVDAEAAVADGRITKAQRDSIAAATRKGTLPPMQTRLGGQILIHGGGNSNDWTLGCVALDNEELDELRALLPANKRAQVLILP